MYEWKWALVLCLLTLESIPGIPLPQFAIKPPMVPRRFRGACDPAPPCAPGKVHGLLASARAAIPSW